MSWYSLYWLKWRDMGATAPAARLGGGQIRRVLLCFHWRVITYEELIVLFMTVVYISIENIVKGEMMYIPLMIATKRAYTFFHWKRPLASYYTHAVDTYSTPIVRVLRISVLEPKDALLLRSIVMSTRRIRTRPCS